MRKADPKLARVIAATGAGRVPLELKTTPSLFGALAEAIVYQQLSGKAAATIYGRVCALFPAAPTGPRGAAPPGSDTALRRAGLSAGEVLALQDLARRARGGRAPDARDDARLDDEAIVATPDRRYAGSAAGRRRCS